MNLPSLVLRLLLCVAALLPAGAVHAGNALVLDDSGNLLDAWPVLRVLADPGREMDLPEARRRLAEFEPPTVPMNNFGPRRDALWLHVPIDQRSSVRRWVLEVDYPALNRIDVYLLRDGQLVRQARMGNEVPAAERPMRTRSHAVALDLPPDASHEIFLRVHSSSTLVVPVRLHPDEEFVVHESARLLLQGLMFGVTLMLLVSSVINGLSLRDPVFAAYSFLLLGVSMFFFSFSGLGHQFLWSEQTGMLAKISPLGALLALASGSLFAVGALEMRRASPWLARALQFAAAACTTAIVASMLGWLDYAQTSFAATLFGPVTLLALYESVRQALAGNRIARPMALGWSAYAVGALSMTALLRGWLPVDFWVQHLFQFASMVEMVAWIRVLALRIEAVRSDAERAAAEKTALHSLAHTDALTGLPNRRGLALALEAALPAARSDNPLAVYLLDLDGFKAVNDRLGHDAGDELLVQVARRLRTQVRGSDLVARLGGDEFVVMMQGIASEVLALRLGQKMLDAFREPFQVAGQECRVGLTIGFALAPHDGTEAGDLLRRADAAMYAGKQGGRHCVHRGGASVGLASA